LKVLHLINNLKREGAQIVVFNLVTSGGGGTRHVVSARDPGGPLLKALAERGIPVFVPDRYYGALATRKSLRFLDKVIEGEAIDIVHAHMADAAFLGWLAARKHRLPLVITHHGHDVLPGCGGGFFCRMVYSVLLAFAAHHARWNVAVAPAVSEALHRRLALPRNRIKLIVNGVPLPELTPVVRPGHGKGMRIVSVGRLVKLKGQDQLIDAAADLVREDPDVRVSIVGDGPERESLRRRAVSLGLEGHVAFTGAVDDVSAYLREADVFVSASHREGMPLCVLEAMAWRVPVVASDVAGHRGVIGHGETGLLFPPGDAQALARAARKITDEPDLTRDRVRRARRLVEERYSIDAAVRSYEQVYADVLRDGRRPGEMPAA
jgi:glycosyltransferase involved in cell wall biosynthesis